MGTLIEKTSYDLGLMVAANMSTAGVPIEVQEYYLTNRHLIPEALRRGFVIPQPEVQIQSASTTIIASSPTLFKTADTDLDFWLDKCQEFSKKFLGVEIDLRERFTIPAELPWKSVIPVFDLGDMTNRDAVQKILKASGLAVYEEVDLMKYFGSEASKGPTLHFINNSIRPDDDTMGLSPDQLVATGKNWLDLRGYALAFAVHHFATGQYLDPQTFTWFPKSRLSDGKVARGGWSSNDRGVRFNWSLSGDQDGRRGARLAMPCPLLP